MTLKEVLYIHHRLIEDFGGLHGVRDEQRLASALQKIHNHRDPINAAAYFVRDVIQFHPFVDGNKRTAITIMAIYLHRNSINLTATPKSLENFAVHVAKNSVSVKEINSWIQKNTTIV